MATLFNGKDCTGNTFTLTIPDGSFSVRGDISDLNNANFNDKASSVKVPAPYVLKLWSNADKGGPEEIIQGVKVSSVPQITC